MCVCFRFPPLVFSRPPSVVVLPWRRGTRPRDFYDCVAYCGSFNPFELVNYLYTSRRSQTFPQDLFSDTFCLKIMSKSVYYYFFSELGWCFGLWTLSTPRLGAIALLNWKWFLACICIYIYTYTFCSNRDFFFRISLATSCFHAFLLETSAALHGFILISGHAGMGVAILCSHATASGRAAFGWKTGRSLLPSRSGFLGRCH